MELHFDPYAINDQGIRINKFHSGLLRMTSANINMGFTLASKNSENLKQSDNSRSGGRRDDLFGRAEDFADSSFDLNEDLEDSEEEKDDNNEEDNIELYNNQFLGT